LRAARDHERYALIHSYNSCGSWFLFLKHTVLITAPQFKAEKKHKDSYRTGMAIGVDLDNQTITVLKIGDEKQARECPRNWYQTL
jgi:hypothetical protein